MPLFYSTPELKEIREVYRTFGITNSAVLDQIKIAIQASHFDSDAIEEITDLTEQYVGASRAETILPYYLKTAIDKTKKMSEIHELAKLKRKAVSA